MGKGNKEITAGFWYHISAHLALCHGPVDSFNKIRFGDKTVWVGSETSNGSLMIDKPDIFGGDEREGGVVGRIGLVMGSKTEGVDAYLASVLPNATHVPGFRGKAAIILKDTAVSANNPNIRPVNVEVTRVPCKGWYDSTSKPGTAGGVNPAHIIRECLIDETWGLGYSEDDLDDASFRAAALTLYDEAFGLSFVWQSSGSLQDFISDVIQHAQASLFIDPHSGRFVLKLVRMDYDVETLPMCGEHNIISVDNYERSSVGELISQVSVVWHDSATDKQRSTTVHNSAVRELQGGTVATTLEFPGIPDADLANKVATRELRKLSTSVSRAVIRADRSAAFNIGDVFKLNWPDLGIDNVIMRVGKIEFGNLNTGEVRIHCVEDIFTFGQSLYASSSDTMWEDPINLPKPCPHRRAAEAPFIMVSRFTNESPTALSEIDPMSGFLTFTGSLPTYDAFSYKLHTTVSASPYTFRMTSPFCPTAIVTNALDPAITSVLNLIDLESFSLVKVGTYAYIGDECVEVAAITSSTVTVNRGILDTVPTSHPANTRIWFAENFEAYDETQWAAGVVAKAKALPTTGKGTLDISLAPEDSVQIARRWYRPYPPGNLKINNVTYPVSATGDLTFTWNHRDRTTQLSYYVKQNEGNFGPEVGVTYNLRLYEDGNTLVENVTGLTGTSHVSKMTNTALLMHFNGANGSTSFTDSSPVTKSVSRFGNAKISSDVTLLDSTCGYFDGSGAYLTVPDHPHFSVSGNLTIDAWVHLTEINKLNYIVRKGSGSNYNNGFIMAVRSNNVPYFIVGYGPNYSTVNATTALGINTTYHIRAVKSGLDLYIFVDGTLEGTLTMTSTATDNVQPLYIGIDPFDPSRDFKGYMDELRIQNEAVSTSSFTPPTVEFTPTNRVLVPPARVELEAVRDGLTSLYKHDVTFNHS